MATIQPLTFSPTSISGCTLWLDAADRTTQSVTANSITTWRDKSGQGNNATASSGPTQDTYNGYPVVSFNGSTQSMASANTVPLTTHTLIAVHRPALINGNFVGNTSLFRYQVLNNPYVVFPYMAGSTPNGYITSAGPTITNLVDNSVTTS